MKAIDLFAVGEAAVQNPVAFAADFALRISEFDSLNAFLPPKPDVERIERLVVDIRTRDREV